ncbi:MAG: hypothetical protein SGPRY_014546, partial [Prymnesium sp.]
HHHIQSSYCASPLALDLFGIDWAGWKKWREMDRMSAAGEMGEGESSVLVEELGKRPGEGDGTGSGKMDKVWEVEVDVDSVMHDLAKMREEEGEEEHRECLFWQALSHSEPDWIVPLNELRVEQPAECAICLERGENNLYAQLCGQPHCTAAHCAECLARHIEVSIEGSLYSVPPMRCPSCRCRMPMLLWSQLASDEALRRVVSSARGLLAVRCSECHEVEDLISPSASGAERRQQLQQLAAAVGPHAQQLCDAWARFARSEMSAGELLVDLEQMLDLSRDEKEQGKGELGGRAPDGLDQLMRSPLPSLVLDLERRTALQLAYYRRYPMILTPCCEAEMCFKCKLEGHHYISDGLSCEEMQRAEMNAAVQYCPECEVPTVRSEGCEHMVCVCGADWTWEEE